ncbi:hypothetical protein GCM10027182_11610 [Aquaspirillum soli]
MIFLFCEMTTILARQRPESDRATVTGGGLDGSVSALYCCGIFKPTFWIFNELSSGVKDYAMILSCCNMPTSLHKYGYI